MKGGGDGFGRRRFTGVSSGVTNRVCITPDAAIYYGEYPRRSQIKSYLAHEKEYWRSQQQEELEKLDGMFQEYKQSSRRGNKAARDVTATWTPTPRQYIAQSSYGRLGDEFMCQRGTPDHCLDSRGWMSNRTSNFGALSFPGGSSNASDLCQSSHPGSPVEDEDVLKEAFVAARNIMEDQQPICIAKSVSGGSVFSDSDTRSSIQNFHGQGVVSSGLQWEEDALFGSETSRSNYSEFRAQRRMYGDYKRDSLRGQDQDIYENYRARQGMQSEPKSARRKPSETSESYRTANVHKTMQGKQGSGQQFGTVTPRRGGTKGKANEMQLLRNTYGVNEKRGLTPKCSPVQSDRTKGVGSRTPNRSSGLAGRSPPAKQTERSSSRYQVPSRSKHAKGEQNPSDGKQGTPYGSAKRVVSKVPKYDPGSGHIPYNKGGSTPFGPAQRIQESKGGTGGPMRTPREEGASSLKPRMPLSKPRMGMGGGSGGKMGRPSTYSNIRG